MASHPPGHCCTIGVKHEGEALGEFKDIGGTSTYVVYPKSRSTENAIIIMSDVWGHRVINPQLVADQFAANGYFTVMPDLFHGEALDPNPDNRPKDFDFQAWLRRHPTARVDPVVTAVISELRQKFGVKRLGGVGYCFGAKYVIRFLGAQGISNNARVDAGYVAHPSFVHINEVKALEGPLSIAAAETDDIFPEEKRHETEKVLKEMSLGEKKLPWQINLYSGVEHSFAMRGDMTKKVERFAKEQAFIQAVQWFDEFLKGSDSKL